MPSIAPLMSKLSSTRSTKFLADQLNGFRKNLKTPIELRVEPRDLHDAKVGVACIQSRNDPGKRREHQVGPEFGWVPRCATP